ncbi:MAG TPA: hypothetical protein VGR47_01020 [Terracidiphilus sp.]|nr:hypothetical protein [Terracidiphilus sp.]
MQVDELENSQRIRKFGKFFTGYMGTASLITAALPIPIASLDLIPTYASQTKFLNTYASLACFLVFAYIFYNRHSLARSMFHKEGGHMSPRAWISVLPAVFVACSIASAISYHAVLGASLETLSLAGAHVSTSMLLAKIDYREIPAGQTLIALYLGMFVFAESAFVLMALREYLQDILGLDERNLITGTRR